MAFKMRGLSAFTKKTNGDPPPTIGKGGEYTTSETTYYTKAGKKLPKITEEDTGKIQKKDSICSSQFFNSYYQLLRLLNTHLYHKIQLIVLAQLQTAVFQNSQYIDYH